MKLRLHSSGTSGASLVELMLTFSIATIIGGMLYNSMHTTFELAAKNQQVNYTHQQSRLAVNRVLQEIRNSVSTPILIDTDLNNVATATAAGVRYQVYYGGPHVIASDVSKTSLNVKVQVLHNMLDNRVAPVSPATPYPPRTQPVPTAGMKLVVPVIGIECPIASCTAVSTGAKYDVYQLVLSKFPSFAMTVKTTGSTPSPAYLCYYVKSCALVVDGGELRYYDNAPSKTAKYTVLARNVTDPTDLTAAVTPFSIPTTTTSSTLAGGGTLSTTTNYVQMDLPLIDPKGTNRKYVSLDTKVLVKSAPKTRLVYKSN